MARGSGNGPFRPGAGVPPPVLAGRETEQAMFRRTVQGLSARVPPPADAVLYGPRGNGKTSLLAWLAAEAKAVRGVDALVLDPSEIPDTAALAARLARRPFRRPFAPAEATVRGVTSQRSPGEGPRLLRETLERRVRRRGSILLFDEAHTLPPEVGRSLLTVSQQVRSRGLRFLLVLAGTPDLRDRLAETDATFWNRSEIHPIGRLGAEAGAQAIREPLADDGITIPDDVLDRVLAECHAYPFFLQLWGHALWKRADAARRDGAAPAVTVEAVDLAASEFERRKRFYYFDRYREMEKAELLEVAASVAEAFAVSPKVTSAQLRAAITAGIGEGSDPARIDSAETTLRQTGFVWRGGGDTRWEPGIPSLMDYMREETAKNIVAAR